MRTSDLIPTNQRVISEFAKYLSQAGCEAVAKAHWLGTGAVAELEAKLRRHYGMRYAVSVTNATTGLMVLALALGFREAEFITTPYTFGGTLAPWLLLRNVPHFADIDPHDLGINPDAARELMTPNIKAILTVDLFGIPADMRALRKLADDFEIWLISDAAQSFGSRRDGLPGSALADALVVSFTATKTLAAGEGGAILTNNSGLFEKLLWFGMHAERQRREVSLALANEFGLNARIHPLAAIWANATFDSALAGLEEWRAWCFRVIRRMNASGSLEPIAFDKRSIAPSFARLTAAWRNGPQAADLQHWLAADGIRIRIEPCPVRIAYRQPAFQAQFSLSKKPHCPVAEGQAEKRFCIVQDCGRRTGAPPTATGIEV